MRRLQYFAKKLAADTVETFVYHLIPLLKPKLSSRGPKAD